MRLSLISRCVRFWSLRSQSNTHWRGEKHRSHLRAHGNMYGINRCVCSKIWIYRQAPCIEIQYPMEWCAYLASFGLWLTYNLQTIETRKMHIRLIKLIYLPIHIYTNSTKTTHNSDLTILSDNPLSLVCIYISLRRFSQHSFHLLDGVFHLTSYESNHVINIKNRK